MASPKIINTAITVQGTVQGVGFRPFVYTLARELGLSGTVANSGKGVEIALAGSSLQIEQFLSRLRTDPPPLAVISQVVRRCISSSALPFPFVITTTDSGRVATRISPDAATCKGCLEDILSPDNRRHQYPFTNCTNCGPRLTIIHNLPYDRAGTSMAMFQMCPACNSEYGDPQNRRFHAQPNGCPDCGPTVSWHDNSGSEISRRNTKCLAGCVKALQEGKVVAIKGLGGFHLVVNGCDDGAVSTLCQRKNRYGKPLAVMASSLEAAHRIGILQLVEEEALLSPIHPIVLAKKKQGSTVLSNYIAPALSEVGIMLPYTPLHHLLFALEGCPEFLVMTSGNKSGEPLCIGNGEALEQLKDIADFFLLHDREIVTRVDDSVVRMSNGRLQIIRRARGYAPAPVIVPVIKSEMIGCGAELKNCFALSRPGEVFLSQHIGDLKGVANFAFYEESISYLQHTLSISPSFISRDCHPDYLSSHYGSFLDLPGCTVQHHHAHAAAVMAEHGLTESVAIIYDGAGLGNDGTVWGGEIFSVQGAECNRLGHLKEFSLPGGDRATKEIWRLALSLLCQCEMDVVDLPDSLHSLKQIPRTQRRGIREIVDKQINTPQTSSVGRLFDAIAALLGIRVSVDYEGQAAMELEALASRFHGSKQGGELSTRYSATVQTDESHYLIDYRPLVHWLLEDLAKGVPVAELSYCFHCWLVRSTEEVILKLAQEGRIRTQGNIILGGGCFQNRILLEMLWERLERKKYTLFTAEQVPVNDGGIALGQVYVAAMLQK